MVKYNCLRCGYAAKQKSHLLNHLNRKNICLSLLEDISIETIQNHYGFKTIEKNDTLTAPFDTQIAPFSTLHNNLGCRETAPKQHPNSTF